MDDELTNKIESYVLGVMPEEQRALFEAEILANPTLRKEVELVEQLNNHLMDDFHSGTVQESEYTGELRSFFNSNEAKEIKNKIRKVNDEYKLSSQPRKRKFFNVAAVLVALLMGSFGYLFFAPISGEKMFNSYYSESDLPSVVKRGGEGNPLVQGVISFKDQNYKEAIISFKLYKESSEDIDPTVYLYHGISFLETDEIQLALAEFNKMIASESLDRSKGLWFKALAYIKIEDKEAAKIVLNKIASNSSNFNYEEALELIEKL